jgi:predicted Zn-dependent protease
LTTSGADSSLRPIGGFFRMIQSGTPSKGRGAAPASRAVAMTLAAALAATSVLTPKPAHAQRIPLIRDAEIEQLLRDYLNPILRTAGLSKQNVRVVIINDTGFNAFVMDGRHVFVNAGALLDTKTPNEMIGILAHETGHLAGGHLSRLREMLAAAQTQSIIALLAGVGAAIAVSRQSGGGGGNVGAAVFGPQEAVRRQMLAYIRNQEDQADHAAIKYLQATGQSTKGMVDLFKRMSNDLVFRVSSADPYQQTHPLPADRVAALEVAAKASPTWDKKDSAELQLRHDLARAKLAGFLNSGDSVARRYPASDTGLPARYARAIAAYRHADIRNAIGQIDALIAAQPNNAYFHELKGQLLLESGRAAESVGPLRRAAQLAPQPALIQIMLGQALLASGDKNADEAIGLLRTALQREPQTPDAYSHLAIAFGKKGDLGQADLASAEAAYLKGDSSAATLLATRAKGRFPVGSPSWVRADDIVSAKKKPN